MLQWLFCGSESRGYSLVVVCGLLIAVDSLVAEQRLLSTGSVVVPHELSCSEARGAFLDQTHVSCTGRQILYHKGTREALKQKFLTVCFG